MILSALIIFNWSKAQTTDLVNTSLGEMFRLASLSEYIATGVIIQHQPIGRKLGSEELVKLDDLSKTLGGT